MFKKSLIAAAVVVFCASTAIASESERDFGDTVETISVASSMLLTAGNVAFTAFGEPNRVVAGLGVVVGTLTLVVGMVDTDSNRELTVTGSAALVSSLVTVIAYKRREARKISFAPSLRQESGASVAIGAALFVQF